MLYAGTVEQRRALREALRQLNAAGISDDALAYSIRKALAAGSVPGNISGTVKRLGVSRESISAYRRESDDKLNGAGDVARSLRKALVYNYLSSTEDYVTILSPLHHDDMSRRRNITLARAVSTFFATETTLPYEKFNGLQGDFAMFRPLWTSRDESRLVRSIVRIRIEEKVLLYSETQDYEDPNANLKVFEFDEGYVMTFDKNAFVLSKERSGHSLKFIVINHFLPYLNGSQIDLFSGTVVGVAGPGPHPGFPFICRRIRDNDTVSRVVEVESCDNVTREFFDKRTR